MEENIGFVKIFGLQFLMVLLILACPEHELTIFGKCLSVRVSVRVSDKNFVVSVAQELINRIS